MDQNLQTVIEKRMQRTVDALNKHHFDAHLVKTREELLQKLSEYLPAGTSCSVGGSVTLFETGVIDYLKNGDFSYIDRYAPGADTRQCFRDALTCQVYLTSTNAITETGELYNMDGNGNRVAALIYGPDKVIVIAGYNKIVRDLDEARRRNREIAAPGNAVRLNKDGIPCFHTGYCTDCKSPGRFCCHEVVTHQQIVQGRITVLLVAEELGY